jgi:fatty acid desaturase/1-acyl-sn-glycerol-3-phosphate acyltransferase
MEHRSHIAGWLVAVLWPVHFVFMRLYFRLSVRGRERLPRRGPLILAPTHRSKWDALALGCLPGGPLRYLANRDDFAGVQGWFMRRLGAFPVNVDRPGPGAMRHCRDLIGAGRPLVVFPEGTIYYYGPGEVHPLKPGAAWLALPGRRRAPGPPPRIVPIRLIYGDRRLRFRSRIEVAVGEPIDPADYRHLPRKDAIRAMTSDLQGRLGERVNVSPAERYPARAFLARAGDRAEAHEGGPPARNAWLRSLGPGARAEIRRLHRLRPAWNLVLLLYPAVWGVGAALAVGATSWPARLAGYVAAGVAVHALATLMHEGIHGTLFRRRGLDRGVGFLLGVPALFSITAYKVSHLAHHRHTRTRRDPDEFLNVSPHPAVRSAVFYAWLAVGMLAYVLHVPAGAWRRGRPEDRRAIALEYALMLSLYAAAIGMASRFGRLDVVVYGWLIPLSVAIAFGNARSWAEHALTVPGDPMTHTRTVTSNRVVSLLMCNLNYHLEHHLCPGVPWYNLPRLHALLAPEYRAAGAFVHRSYLRFLWEAARVGVHGRSSTELNAGGAAAVPGAEHRGAGPIPRVVGDLAASREEIEGISAGEELVSDPAPPPPQVDGPGRR